VSFRPAQTFIPREPRIAAAECPARDDDERRRRAMIVLAVLIAVVGAFAAAFALYLVAIAAASAFYSQTLDGFSPHTRLVVLIPAHDEELLIARTVSSLLAQSYPRKLYRIVVIADNCADQTAAAATAAGADTVMVRHDLAARGKGRALRWAMDQILAGAEPPDAIVSIDADTIADPELLCALAERFEAGAEAVQSDYRAIGDGSAAAALRETAFLVMNRVRPAGRNVLGMSAGLVGNGWLLGSALLRRRPWEAFTSTEDREYSLELQTDGVIVTFAGAAAVHAPTAPTHAAAATQQERWEGGWASLMRTRLPGLLAIAVRRRSPRLLMVAFDLALPPLGLLAAGALAGLVLSGTGILAGAWSAWSALPWLVALLSVGVYVIGGLFAVGAPPSAYRALLHAPGFILAKPLSLRRTLSFRGDTWVRTERVTDGVEV
jgi:cellulose synthase/poly-beta-1,6-N-acetylglucosamine synthase-like glycosyltransferase